MAHTGIISSFGAPAQGIVFRVRPLDSFYLTNQSLTVRTETQNDTFSLDYRLDLSATSHRHRTENSRNDAAVTSRHNLMARLSKSSLRMNGEVYHRFHTQLQIPPLLQWLQFNSLTYVNLTTTVTNGEPKMIFVSVEYSDLSPDELVYSPLNKAKTLYVALRKDDVERGKESLCHDREETDHTYYLNNGYYKSVVTSTHHATLQHNFQYIERASTGEDEAQLKQQTSKVRSSHRKMHLKLRSTSRNNQPIMEVEIKKSSKDDKVLYRHNYDELRPFVKAGNMKPRTVVHHETQSGSSSMKFSTELSVLNVLREHAHHHPLQVLCLPKRDVSSDSILASAGRLSRLRSMDEPGSSCAGAERVSVRHQVRQRYMEKYQSLRSTRQLASVGRMDSEVPVSTTRDVVEADYVKHCFTRTPFDSKELTQLLHASDYPKILQQLGTNTSVPPDSLIPALFIKGVAYFKMAKYTEAQESFKKCEATAKEAKRDGDVMLCNAYLGDIEYATQKFSEAVHYYKRAIANHSAGCVAALFKLNPPSLSAVHAKLASSYRNASMMVQAIQHYKMAISEAKLDRDKLAAHTSLGNLYQSMGDNSSALEEYKQSIELATKLSDQVSLGWAHGNIGNAYLGLNKKDEALHHLQKSLDLAVEFETTPQAIGRTYNNLGTAYQSMNDLDKAEEYYDLALSQAIYGNDIPGQARVYGNIGNVYMLRKNYERAIPHYSEVLRLSSDPSTVSTARHNRGCAYYDWATSLNPKKTYKTTCTMKDQLVVSAPNSASDYQFTFHNGNCDIDSCLCGLPRKAKELYRNGCTDLRKVVDYHEERLEHIKGSPRGLTLSVSLFESNSRTFHRLQDCLVNLHKFEEALVVAEQSRARTLGELLLKRKGGHVKKPLTSPLNFDEIESILKTLESPVLYLSYTGARLICWLFVPYPSELSMNAFEIPLADDQFDGKSFDYLLRYSLTENLVERSFEMYQAIKYNTDSSSAVQELYKLVGEPTQKVLQRHNGHLKTPKVTTISDSYTSLLPLTCLFDNQLNSFLGDHYFFNQIPSLLTLGIINQFPSIEVDLGENDRDICIVGDPSIPPFYHNGELWSLGRLPHARKEAEWVAHALQTTPVLGEQATKSSLLIRLMNAKVVHIATHGSASVGFLAFSSFAVHANEGLAGRNQVHGRNVLLFPEEVEKLNISPALVVLSSCDSGRGIVKADGIQGMARAFILAGAQSVLTTLWKIPDESASVFMQFFYQYLLDEMKSTFALQKAILSVRCFAKYSQYIHWSGYQLTGRDIQFLSKPTRSSVILKQHLGEPSIFPRLSSIKKLENALVSSPCLPTDVQVVKGCPGVEPVEVVVDFIASFHKKFPGGIFWINCSVPEVMHSSIKYAEEAIGTDLSNLPVSEVQHALFVFDNMTHLPNSEDLLRILKNQFVHVIVLSMSFTSPDKLVKEIDHKLVRGCKFHNIEPLTKIHSTQRMVHTLLKKLDVTPANADQEMFENLAEFTTGSPVVVGIASEVVLSCYDRSKIDAVPHLNNMLSIDPKDVQTPPGGAEVNLVSKTFDSSQECKKFYQTDSAYDSWDSISKLLEECDLSQEESLLLNSLSIFGRNPIPFSFVIELSSLITQSTQRVHLAATLHRKLLQFKLVKRYPHPVVFHPVLVKKFTDTQTSQEPEFVYVPQQLSTCLWNLMEEVDKVAALSVAYSALTLYLCRSGVSCDVGGLCSLLLELFEENYTLVGEQCYQQMCKLFFNYCR